MVRYFFSPVVQTKVEMAFCKWLKNTATMSTKSTDKYKTPYKRYLHTRTSGWNVIKFREYGGMNHHMFVSSLIRANCIYYAFSQNAPHTVQCTHNPFIYVLLIVCSSCARYFPFCMYALPPPELLNTPTNSKL